MTFLRFILSVILGLVVTVPEASAALLFCNHTKFPIEAAVGYKEGGLWVSEGWWQIKPGLCSRTYDGPLSEGFYFYHVRLLGAPDTVQTKSPLSGKYGFCIRTDKAFLIEGEGDCAARTSQPQGFKEIPIAPNVKDFTVEF